MGLFVVVHPCSNFSLSRQMALLQSFKFQTAFFSDFLRSHYCDFLNNVYRLGSEVCSLVVICNDVCRYCSVSKKAFCFRF